MLNDYLLILTINTLWNQNEKKYCSYFLTDFEKKKIRKYIFWKYVKFVSEIGYYPITPPPPLKNNENAKPKHS